MAREICIQIYDVPIDNMGWGTGVMVGGSMHPVPFSLKELVNITSSAVKEACMFCDGMGKLYVRTIRQLQRCGSQTTTSTLTAHQQ
jgi:hypothetical protein